MENFYDGYMVNEIMDACYRSASIKKMGKCKPEGLERESKVKADC